MFFYRLYPIVPANIVTHNPHSHACNFHLSSFEQLSLPWFPTLGLAPGIPLEFNFGHKRPLKFDVMAFEVSLEETVIEAITLFTLYWWCLVSCGVER